MSFDTVATGLKRFRTGKGHKVPVRITYRYLRRSGGACDTYVPGCTARGRYHKGVTDETCVHVPRGAMSKRALQVNDVFQSRKYSLAD